MKKILSIIIAIVLSNIIVAQNNTFIIKSSVVKNKTTQKVMVQLKFVNYTDIVSNYNINIFRKDALSGWQKINTTPIVKTIASKESPFVNNKSYQRYANFALRKIEPDKENNTKAFAGIALLNDNKMAEFAGCYFEDKTVEEGKTYQYKITDANKNEVEIAEIISLTAVVSQKKIQNFSFTQNNQTILFNWQTSADFFSYNIYKKTANSDDIVLSKNPFTIADVKEKVSNPIYYKDANQVAGSKFIYTVVAYDVLGNIIATSNPLNVVVKDFTLPNVVTNFTNERKNKSFILSWKPTIDKKCVGYNVYRNTDDDTIYRKVNTSILPILTNSYIDNVPTDATAYSYYIESVGSNGNKALSMITKAVMPDITAPLKPKNVTGVSTPGIVKITWQANKERDVKGYWVYRATTKKDGYFNIIHQQLITTNSFIDTLPKTSKNDFVYKIQAVDLAYNKSELSDTVIINLPDITPPTTVQEINAELTNNAIVINWSKAVDDDAAGYTIYKITNIDTRVPIKLNNTLLQDTRYVDTNFSNNGGITIAYYITVTDKSNNISEPSILTHITLPTDTTLNLQATNIAITKNTSDNSNTISWLGNTKKIQGFIVFRKSTEEENFVAISDMISTLTYKDENIENRVSYEYYIRTFYTNGSFKNSVIAK